MLLLAFMCMFGYTYAYESNPTGQESNKQESNKEVVPVTLKGVIAEQPRGLTPQVDCYYYDGRLYVDLLGYVDNVYVSVTDLYTGEQYDTMGSGYSLSINLDVPCNAGEYYVEVEVDSVVLYGYYQLL